MIRNCFRFFALAAVFATASIASAQYQVTDMGFFPNSSLPVYMNQAGVVAQGNYIYNHGVLTTLPNLQSGAAEALGINANNQVVGYSNSPTNSHAFSFNGSITDLGTMGGVSADATGIDDSGKIVGGYITMPNNVTVQKGFEKVGNTVTTLKSLYGGLYDSVSVRGVTNTGVVYGASAGYNNPNESLPVIWNSATPTLVPLAAGFSDGTIVNSNTLGQMILNETTAAGVTDMFLYSGGTVTALPSTPYGDGAWALNASGEIVGDEDLKNGGFEDFVYKPGVGFVDLDTFIAKYGYTFFSGSAINDAGKIAGIGWSSNTGYVPLLLTPQAVPEPASWCALGLGSLILVRRRRR